MAKWVVLRNFADTLDSIFKSVATSIRTYTLQDRDGVLADDTDLAGKVTSIASGNSYASVDSSVATAPVITVDGAAIIEEAQTYTLKTLSDADYELILSDGDPVVKFLVMNASAPRTLTLPSDGTAAIPVLRGPIVFLNIGNATVTVAAGSGATVGNYSGTLTIPAGSMATLIKRAASTWRLENVTPAVPTSRLVAGIDLVDDITVAELAVALGIGEKKVMTADFALTSTTYVDNAPSSGPVLSFSVSSGVAVEIFAFIIATTSDGNGGMGISVNGPTLTSYFSQILIPTSATAVVSRSGTTYGTETVSASILTTGGISIARFKLLPSASGTVILRHSCETTVGHTITIKAGSFAIAI